MRIGTLRISSLIVLLAAGPASVVHAQCETWKLVGGGVVGGVNATTTLNGELVVAGSITSASGTAMKGVAHWNGTIWQKYGAGLTLRGVLTGVVPYQNGLAVCGDHHDQWTGSVWQAIGQFGAPMPMGAQGHDVTVFNNDLYVVGSFQSIDGPSAWRVARWNGTAWSGLSTGLNSTGYTCTVYGDDLIVGGNFTQAGGVATGSIARWDGAAWHTLAGQDVGNTGHVFDLTTIDADLYAGGSFTSIGGVPANGIARWDGSAWHALGGGITGGYVKAIHKHRGKIIAGGSFTMAGGKSITKIASWDGDSWKPIGPGFSSTIQGLNSYNGELIAVGLFTGRVASWTHCCPADVNESGVVDADDLLGVINSWGACSGCAADINTSGQVNVDDLLKVINGWGACP